MFKKISARKISDEIVEQFKEMLSKGELKPGNALPSEREMANMIGVSRPPLREALNALQTMGFIEIKPRSKIIVKSLTEKLLDDPLSHFIADNSEKLFELLEIRMAVESWVAFKAAQRANQADVEKLAMILQKEQVDFKNGIDDARTDADFHVTIALATQNTLIPHIVASCYQILWNQQKVSREKIFRKKGNMQLVAAQHRKIFEAIKNKDADSASIEARKHIDFVEKELRDVLRKENIDS